MKRFIKNQKILAFFFIFSILITIALTTWMGNKDRLFYTDSKHLSKDIKYLKSNLPQIESSHESAILHFNVGVLQYREEQFENAIRQFQDVLNQKNTSQQTRRAAFYNIGNAYFKKMESADKLPADQKLLILQKSLTAYRGAIEIEERQIRSEGESVERDSDLAHNYLLIQQHIKILKDQLKKKNRQENQNKTPYQLIEEVRELELEVQKILKAGGEKNKLMSLKEESLKKLSILKEKLNNPKSVTPPAHIQKQGMKI